MSDCISLRISAIINDLFDGNKSEFARTVGISEAAVRSYMANTIPKADVLEKIASKTAISCEWLILGRGNMIVQATEIAPPSESALEERLLAIIKEKDIKIEEQAKTIGRLEERVETLSKKSIGMMDAGGATCAAANE
jgi:hypothetical protein